MAELDLLEDVFKADDRGSLFDRMSSSFDTQEVQADIKNLIGDYQENGVKLDFKLVDGNPFAIVNGEDLNLSDLRDMYKTGGKYPLGDLGIDTNTPEAKEFATNTENTWKQSNMGQLAEQGKNVEIEMADFKNLPEPENEEELYKTLSENIGDEKTAEVKTMVQDYKGVVDDVKEGKTEKAKTWYDKLSESTKKMIKFTAFLALIVFAGYEFTKFISALAHELSGCFAAGPNGICKIYALTCNKDDLTSNSTMCEACQKFDCSDLRAGTPGWVPLKALSCSCDPTKKADFPGQYNPDAPTSSNTCGGKNPACPIKPASKYYGPVTNYDEIMLKASQGTSACPNADGCVSRVEACDGNNDHCSSLCNNDSLKLPASISVQCKVTSWWGALGHFAGDIIKPVVDPLKNILSGALKGLIWIALIIVSIIGAFFVLKEIWAVTGSSDKASVSKK